MTGGWNWSQWPWYGTACKASWCGVNGPLRSASTVAVRAKSVALADGVGSQEVRGLAVDWVNMASPHRLKWPTLECAQGYAQN